MAGLTKLVINITLAVILAGLLLSDQVTAHRRNRHNNRHRPNSGGLGSRHSGAHLAGCDAEEYRCRGSTAICIPSDWRCDNDPDCPLGDDEEACVTTCSTHEFICRGGSNNCIPNTWRCDGDPDCPDGSDEALCDSAANSLPGRLGQALSSRQN